MRPSLPKHATLQADGVWGRPESNMERQNPSEALLACEKQTGVNKEALSGCNTPAGKRQRNSGIPPLETQKSGPTLEPERWEASRNGCGPGQR